MVKPYGVLVVLLVMTLARNVSGEVVPEHEWNDETKVWLARSLVGEAGWRRPVEYAAIAWVYVARARLSKSRNFLQIVRRYSAAVKNRRNRQRPWLYQLGFDGARPDDWPSGPMWAGLHKEAWLDTLDWCDEWQAGKHPNPCPRANHFGGYADEHRAEALRWTRIKCEREADGSPLRNRFYDSTRLRPKGWYERRRAWRSKTRKARR